MKIFVRRLRENCFVIIALMTYTFCVGMLCDSVPFLERIPRTDSSVFRYIAFGMSKGQIPYKDMFDHKGLLLYFLNFLGMSWNGWGLWILELCGFMVTFVFFYKIARLFQCGRLLSVFCVGLSMTSISIYLDGGNLTEEYALPFIAICLYYFNEYLVRNTLQKWKVMLCGISFVAVVMLRANMIGVWLAFVLIIVLKEIKTKEWRKLKTEILYFILGIIVGVFPFLLYLAVNHAFLDFWNSYIVFNIKYSGSEEGVGKLVQAFLNFTENEIFYFVVTIYVFLYIILYRKGMLSKGWVLHANLVSFLIVLTLVCMPGRTYVHYGMMIIPTMIVPISLFCELLHRDFEKEVLAKFVVFAWLCAGIFYPTWRGMLFYALDELNAEKPKYEFEHYVDAINNLSDEGDTISVWGNEDDLYLRSNRLSGTRFSYQFPIFKIDDVLYEEYKTEIEKNRPAVIVFVDKKDPEFISDILSWGYLEYEENIYFYSEE